MDRFFLRSHTRYKFDLYQYVFLIWTSIRSIRLTRDFTALIATKIWKINSYTAAHVFENKMRPVMLVVLESGAMYSGTLFALLITYLVGSWAQYLILDAVRNSFVFADSSELTLTMGIRYRVLWYVSSLDITSRRTNNLNTGNRIQHAHPPTGPPLLGTRRLAGSNITTPI